MIIIIGLGKIGKYEEEEKAIACCSVLWHDLCQAHTMLAVGTTFSSD